MTVGRTPSASELSAPRTWLNHATAPARFSYRINIPNPTRTAPAIDFDLRKAVCCLAIAASSGPFFLGSTYSSNEESRDRQDSLIFFEVSAELQFPNRNRRRQARVFPS